jgi:hypothetical protein
MEPRPEEVLPHLPVSGPSIHPHPSSPTVVPRKRRARLLDLGARRWCHLPDESTGFGGGGFGRGDGNWTDLEVAANDRTWTDLEVADGDGAWMDLEVAADDGTWTGRHNATVWSSFGNRMTTRSCSMASRSLWWCRLGPAVELDAGSAQVFLRAVTAPRGFVHTGLRGAPATREAATSPKQALPTKGAAASRG